MSNRCNEMLVVHKNILGVDPLMHDDDLGGSPLSQARSSLGQELLEVGAGGKVQDVVGTLLS